MTPSEDFFEKLRQSLVDAGVNTYRAWKVAAFVTQCYDVLLSAHHALVQPSRWQEFCATRGANAIKLSELVIIQSCRSTFKYLDIS